MTLPFDSREDVVSPSPSLALEVPGSTASNYRRDIDGLRAVAVLAVILFHATPLVPGGFVGVDVFFVISGFLITGQIAAELDDGRFSLATFWDRRVRRIWPAAWAVTCAVLAVGWLLLTPIDYVTTAGDAMAQALMLANVHFWKNVAHGYFAPSSDSRPLLHMWSLAVEEQFYLFFPLLMMACWRLGRNRCAWLLGILAMASFALSVAWLPSQQKAVFYLLPFRAWELLLGSLVALVSARPWRIAEDQSEIVPRLALSQLLAEAGSMLGLCMILGCCLFYTKNTAFPAAAAVPPCLGAVLIIAACCSPSRRSPIGNQLLSLQPLPMIGKVSYSLYLWHWPVLAFMRYCVAEPSSHWTIAAMVALLPASYVSWRWIEQPFRLRLGHSVPERPLRSMAIAAWRPVLIGAVAWLVVYAAGRSIDRQAGIPSRFKTVERQFLRSSRFASGTYRFATIGFDDRSSFLDHPLSATLDSEVFRKLGAESASGCPDVLLWGDSHAMAISVVVDAAARRHGVYGYAALMSGTVPLPGVWNGTTQRERRVCEKWSRLVLDWIRVHRPRHVLVCANWGTYKHVRRIDDHGHQTDGSAGVLRDGLQRLLEECEAVSARVTLMLQVPTQDSLPSQRVVLTHCLGRAIDLAGVDRVALDRQQAEIVAAIAGVTSDHLRVVNLADPFFGTKDRSSVGDAGGSWYFDRSHISGYGSERLFGALLADFMRMVAADRNADETGEAVP